MRPTKKVWFRAGCKRAGWISARTIIVIFGLLVWNFRNAQSPFLPWFYPLATMSLGAVAVGALNWHRWQTFRESLKASVYSVIVLSKLFGLLVLPFTLLIGTKGNLLLLIAIVIFYLAIPLLIWLVVGVPILIMVACIGGSALYGLLMVMRRAGGTGHMARVEEVHKPRPLQMLV